MNKYLFPLNYDESNKILGIVEYKLVVPLSIYGLICAIVLSCFSLSFFLKVGIFISLFLPIVFLSSTSINKEPFYIFMYFVIKHRLFSKKYLLNDEILHTFHK